MPREEYDVGAIGCAHFRPHMNTLADSIGQRLASTCLGSSDKESLNSL